MVGRERCCAVPVLSLCVSCSHTDVPHCLPGWAEGGVRTYLEGSSSLTASQTRIGGRGTTPRSSGRPAVCEQPRASTVPQGSSRAVLGGWQAGTGEGRGADPS